MSSNLDCCTGCCKGTDCKSIAAGSTDQLVADNTDAQCVAEPEVQENFQQVLNEISVNHLQYLTDWDSIILPENKNIFWTFSWVKCWDME